MVVQRRAVKLSNTSSLEEGNAIKPQRKIPRSAKEVPWSAAVVQRWAVKLSNTSSLEEGNAIKPQRKIPRSAKKFLGLLRLFNVGLRNFQIRHHMKNDMPLNGKQKCKETEPSPSCYSLSFVFQFSIWLR
jgi:hypothetical protein